MFLRKIAAIMCRVILWLPALLFTSAIVIYFRLYLLIDHYSITNENSHNPNDKIELYQKYITK